MNGRLDEPRKMKLFEGVHYGEKALLVLGGPSGKDWKKLRDEIQPDIILGANGTCFEIDDLDYHLVVENLHWASGNAARGEERYKRIVQIISPAHHAKVRLISYLNWKPPVLVDSRVKAIKIKRMGEAGDNYEEQFERFSFREYGDGFLAGPIFDHAEALTNPRIQFRVGTVAVQLLHLAGILGVKEVHTIGMDFYGYGHWYPYADYQPDKFRSDKMFTEYAGLKTQHDWLAGARWLKMIEPLFEADELEWRDHSGGLLKAMGLRCTRD